MIAAVFDDRIDD